MLTYYHSPVRSVPYHQQDTLQWCGSACALMVLHSLGIARLDGSNLDQNRLRSVVKNSARLDPSYLWASAPDGLTFALNYFCEKAASKAGTPPARWNVIAGNTEEELSRQIVWHLWRYELPVIALVFGMQHWVVISGCITSQPPTGPDDEEYEIVGFHLRDPWPPLPTKLAHNDAFRHLHSLKESDTADDNISADGCGDGWNGDLSSDEVGGRGVAVRFVSYEDWRMRDTSTPYRKRHTGYMTGVPASVKVPHKTGAPDLPVRSKWVGQFLAICDPSEDEAAEINARGRTPGTNKARRIERYNERGHVRQSPGNKRRTKSGMLYEISEVDAIELAGEIISSNNAHILESHSLKESNGPNIAHHVISHGQVRLVEWLDTPGEYHEQSAYYIVPFTVNHTQHIAVQLGARTHKSINRAMSLGKDKLQLALRVGISAAWLNGKQGGLEGEASAIIDHESARRHITGRSFKTPGGGRFLVPADYAGTAKLVWKPCRESFDPLCPFYEFGVPSQQPASTLNYVYVRSSDGVAYSYLSEYGGGT